jgi:transcription elongation factor Elf1
VAVGLQSVGYRKFYERVFERTGIAVAGDLTFLYLRGEDVEKERKKDYQQLERVKARRLRGYFEKIRKERQKMISDNNRDLTYNSNMMMERQEEEGGSNGEQIRNSVGVKQCSHCGLSSHQRKTHRLCPMNKYNLANDEKNKMHEAGTLNDGLCM